MVAPTVQEKQEKPLDDVVVVTQPTSPPVEEPTWGVSNVVVASVGFLCCQVIGLPALILSMFSYVDHSNKNFAASTRKATRAKRLAIAAILVGLMLMFLMVGWQYCSWRKEMKLKKHKMRGHDWRDGSMSPEKITKEDLIEAMKTVKGFQQQMSRGIITGRGEEVLNEIERKVRLMRGPVITKLHPYIREAFMKLRKALTRDRPSAEQELNRVCTDLLAKIDDMKWKLEPGKKNEVYRMIERFAEQLRTAIRQGQGMAGLEMVERKAMANPELKPYTDVIQELIRRLRMAIATGRGCEEIDEILESYKKWAQE